MVKTEESFYRKMHKHIHFAYTVIQEIYKFPKGKIKVSELQGKITWHVHISQVAFVI